MELLIIYNSWKFRPEIFIILELKGINDSIYLRHKRRNRVKAVDRLAA